MAAFLWLGIGVFFCFAQALVTAEFVRAQFVIPGHLSVFGFLWFNYFFAFAVLGAYMIKTGIGYLREDREWRRRRDDGPA